MRAVEQLIQEIEGETPRTYPYTGVSRIDPRVLDAIRCTPRERFVLPQHREQAYLDLPLSIGHGQSISQPFIVALMTHLLALAPKHHVLEIGTGSAYQAAILSPLVRNVTSLEIIAPLAVSARATLASLKVANVQVIEQDGGAGYIAQAPYDAIMVTAATPEIPPALIHQLREGGRLIIPLGRPNENQMLTLVSKEDGKILKQNILPVRFVPLTHKA